MTEKVYVIGSNSFTGATFVDYLLSRGGGDRHQPVGPAQPAFLPYAWSARPAGARFTFRQLRFEPRHRSIARRSKDFSRTTSSILPPRAWWPKAGCIPDQWYQTNVVANVRFHENSAGSHSSRNTSTSPRRRSTAVAAGNVTENAPVQSQHALRRVPRRLRSAPDDVLQELPVSRGVHPRRQRLRSGPAALPHHSAHDFFHQDRPQAAAARRRAAPCVPSSTRATSPTATLRVARNGPPGETYHLSTDLYISIRELVERICHAWAAEFYKVVEVVGRPPRQGRRLSAGQRQGAHQARLEGYRLARPGHR